MNQNIEVLNEHLWALRFSLIPFIPEIEYKPPSLVYGMKPYMEPCQCTASGILLLNKDHPNYELLKDSYLTLMTKTSSWLRQKRRKGEKKNRTNEFQIFYYSLIDIELYRRKLAKGGVHYGYH